MWKEAQRCILGEKSLHLKKNVSCKNISRILTLYIRMSIICPISASKLATGKHFPLRKRTQDALCYSSTM